MKRSLILIASIFVLALLLTACGSASTNNPSTAKLTSLVVTRTSKKNFVSFTDQTIKDAQRAQQFYNFLYTLPQAPQHTDKYPGPAIDLYYHLSFFQGTSLVQDIKAEIFNYHRIFLTNDDIRSEAKDFGIQFSQITGIPESQFTPAVVGT